MVVVISFMLVNVVSAAGLVPDECRGDADLSTCNLSSVEATIFNIAEFLLGIAGSLALLMFVYGGFLYIIGGASEKQVGKAKDVFKYAITGLIIIFLSGLILRVVVQALAG